MQAPALPIADDPKTKIRQQVEFYFSDSNLLKDKFLLGKLEESGDDRTVPLGLIASFKR